MEPTIEGKIAAVKAKWPDAKCVPYLLESIVRELATSLQFDIRTETAAMKRAQANAALSNPLVAEILKGGE